MVENLYKKTFRELCNDVEESMKHTLDILSEIFDRAAGLDMDKTPKKLEETPKTEETPKKTVKKRAVKAKTVEKTEPTSDILTLNANAPIAEHHYGDKGKGEIDFDRLE
jgi:hypothetical protein